MPVDDSLILTSASAHLMMCANLSESSDQREALHAIVARLREFGVRHQGNPQAIAAGGPSLHLVRDEVQA